jgi:arylsulfatase A-like enzyme
MSDADRPNVLVFFTDQQRWDTVGAYGSPMDLTPNLDAAADSGTRYDVAVSSQPVCGPTRACLQTGQYGTTHGVTTNGGTLPDAPLVAEQFADAGYETGYVGKWHLSEAGTGPVPPGDRGGYDYWRVADLLEFTSHPYEGVVYDEAGDPVEFDGYRVDELTDMALDFVEEAADGDDPFFCTLSHLEPHHQNDMGRYVAPEGYAHRYRDPWVPPDLRGEPGDWYAELPDYYGICRRIDECYGRVLDRLEELGERENTVVLFVSDHGSHFCTRNGEYKRSAHESSVRVPMVATGPGFDGGTVVEDPVSLVDVVPTLLDAAGLAVPDAVEGESTLELVDGDPDTAADWRDEVFVQISEAECGRAIRTDRCKYAAHDPDADPVGDDASPDGEYVERYLYDLAADPYEQHNLAGRSSHADVAERLRERLEARIEAVEGTEVTVRPAEYYP